MSRSRLGYHVHAFEFLELAIESKTRVTAVDDNDETHETVWRVIAMVAAMKRGLAGSGGE
jgi:hypothetical protein